LTLCRFKRVLLEEGVTENVSTHRTNGFVNLDHDV